MLRVVSYQIAPPGKISFIGYLALVIGFIFQITIFNNTPNVYDIIGAILMFSVCIIPIGEEYILTYQSESRNEYTELAW